MENTTLAKIEPVTSFCLLGFLYNTFSLVELAESMRGDAQHLLDTFPDNPKTRERVNIITDRVDKVEVVVSWIRRLESDYNAERKCSYQYRMDNLELLGQVKTLKAENEKLTKILNA